MSDIPYDREAAAEEKAIREQTELEAHIDRKAEAELEKQDAQDVGPVRQTASQFATTPAVPLPVVDAVYLFNRENPRLMEALMKLMAQNIRPGSLVPMDASDMAVIQQALAKGDLWRLA